MVAISRIMVWWWRAGDGVKPADQLMVSNERNANWCSGRGGSHLELRDIGLSRDTYLMVGCYDTNLGSAVSGRW